MLAYACLILCGVASVADVPDPRPGGHVSDQAHVLDAPAAARLDALAVALEATRGIQLAVVTVDDTPAGSKPFATELFNTWRLGRARANNGVLVLLVMGKRRVEVETGTGLEAALPAAWLADMQKDAMVPRFKSKDFAGGLAAGVQAIADHLQAAGGESDSTAPAGEYRNDGVVTAHEVPPVKPRPPASTAQHGDRTGLLWLLAGCVAVLIAIPVGLVVWQRRRQRTGELRSDGTYIYRGDRDEDDDDVYTGPQVRSSFWDFFGGGGSSSSGSSSDDSSSSSNSSSSNDSSSSGGSSSGGGAGSDW